MYTHTQGAEDYLKPIDGNTWLEGMISESSNQPRFYPTWFEQLLDTMLKESWGMSKVDVIAKNCSSVYVKLINCINEG